MLDGNGYQITGMNIYKPDSWGWAGLIAHMDDAIVRNLGMKNVAIDVSASEVGGIAGFVDGSESLIENCYVSGKYRIQMNMNMDHIQVELQGKSSKILIGQQLKTVLIQQILQ